MCTYIYVSLYICMSTCWCANDWSTSLLYCCFYQQLVSTLRHDTCQATVRTHWSSDGLSVTVFQLPMGSWKVVSDEMINWPIILCVCVLSGMNGITSVIEWFIPLLQLALCEMQPGCPLGAYLPAPGGRASNTLPKECLLFRKYGIRYHKHLTSTDRVVASNRCKWVTSHAR